MCDYSLQLVASRPARVGDRLVSTAFYNAVTRGFAAVGEPHVAVCLLPGTEVAFDKDVQSGRALHLFRNHNLKQRLARFRQINLDKPNVHHDTLEFPDGQTVLVAELVPGQYATILQLPASKPTPSNTKLAERAPTGTIA